MSQPLDNLKNSIASLPTKMSRSEKFNFILALIGLSADTIGIATFLFAFGHADTIGTSKEPTALLVFLFVLSGSILIYAWVGITWFFVRRYYKIKIKSKPPKFNNMLIEMCFRASVIGAIFALPGLIMWFCLFGLYYLMVLPFLLTIGCPAITFGIYYLMPVIYEDMMYIMEENPFYK